MSENYTIAQKKKQSQWPYILLLYVSFVWVEIYTSLTSWGASRFFEYGLLSLNTLNSSIIFTILVNGFLNFISFEIVFWFYRTIISFKIYSYIVPAERLKIESRIYFIIRNLIYGLFVNLCIFHPYLSNYIPFVNIVITLTVMLFYVRKIYKRYSEPIVSHFVFRCFCYPLFIFEAISVLSSLMGVA